MLWHVYNGTSLNNSDIPNEFIAYISTLETVGLIGYRDNKPYVKIPNMKKSDYQKVMRIVKSATAEIKSAIGDAFTAFTTAMKTPVPKHLTSVPDLFRCIDATKYFVMAIVREAYGKGLHLKNVDYCCPPAVLVYEM